MNIKYFLSVLGLLAFCGHAQAGLLVAESFDNTGGVGFATKPWTLETVGGDEGYSGTGLSDGLTFSDYPTSGGALYLSIGVSTNKDARVDREIAGLGLVPNGTLWVSYLARRTSWSAGDSLSEIFIGANENAGDGIDGDCSYRMAVGAAVPQLSLGSGSMGMTTSGQNQFDIMTTQMVVMKVTKINGPATRATMWILTSDNYDNWKTDGFTEASLNTNNVCDISDTNDHGLIGFGDGQYVQLHVRGSWAGVNVETFDEIRFGTGDTPIAAGIMTPEPGTLSVLVLGGLAILRRRRRTE